MAIVWAVALAVTAGAFAADTNAPSSAPARTEETNSQELRAYLQLQEQLHSTQITMERNRREAEQAAAESLKTLAARLESIEQSLSAQRSRELDAMQSSNRVMLIVAGSFAGIGFLAMLLTAYFQWRAVSRLAEISAALPPAGFALGPGRTIPALGPGDLSPGVAAGAPVDRASSALLESVARLEKRILELEHTAQPALSHDSDYPANGGEEAGGKGNGRASDEPLTPAARIAMLLGKGQSLLNLEKADEAMVCFDEVLALMPGHPEALVKKGAALERQRKLDEAIECYDRAIAADGSLTIAYLYKAGVYNRLERFSEALECYEQALRTQENRRG